MPEHPAPASHHFARGLRMFFGGIGKTLLSLAAIALVSLILVLPAWYLATSNPTGYTWGLIVLALGLLVVSVLLRVRAESRKTGLVVWAKETLWPGLTRRVPSFFLVLVGLAALVFLVMELPAPAALAALVFFLGLGIYLFR